MADQKKGEHKLGSRNSKQKPISAMKLPKGPKTVQDPLGFASGHWRTEAGNKGT